MLGVTTLSGYQRNFILAAERTQRHAWPLADLKHAAYQAACNNPYLCYEMP